MFRGAVASLIYAKTLKLRAGVYDEAAALTLMSTDIDRIVVSLQSINEIWARVIEIAIGIWLLERQLGWVCIFPIILVVGTDPPSFLRCLTLLISCSRICLWSSENCKSHWWKAEGMGRSCTASSRHYLFDAWVHESRQNDGSVRYYALHYSITEGSRTRSFQKISSP